MNGGLICHFRFWWSVYRGANVTVCGTNAYYAVCYVKLADNYAEKVKSVIHPILCLHSIRQRFPRILCGIAIGKLTWKNGISNGGHLGKQRQSAVLHVFEISDNQAPNPLPYTCRLPRPFSPLYGATEWYRRYGSVVELRLVLLHDSLHDSLFRLNAKYFAFHCHYHAVSISQSALQSGPGAESRVRN